MKIVSIVTYIFSLVFIAGETLRRGIGYFSVNATTMVEDYLCGALLLLAAVLWSKGSKHAHKYMIGAWGYAAGGMLVPFFAHLEAYLRGVQIRSDHPIDDVNSVILKGVIWGVCVICFIVTLKTKQDLSLDDKGASA
ncbi:hypothetical protein [Vibrio breoganii]|uniref:Uncharacterized protein n=1 Tax=Vibrio breoganii TaxID=553239 RepID=A0ABX1UGD3_9VIBR|nr:hypothetical protein [Vibrio breoganii]NMO75280.1 hypothetical protein [Vibrio breoganii]NMR71805.1 hypothetical protein [Vibrio breoganii]PML88233.1 hypothetical protein BCT67_10445 [Vibrio breoganii]